MILIKQNWQFVEDINGIEILKKIEQAGRTCYKSEGKITDDSYKSFLNKIIDSGHHSVIEHHFVTVRIITDRGVTHELVRHRLVSYSQESTRYCNYSSNKFGKQITFIIPVWLYELIPEGSYSYEKGWFSNDYLADTWFRSMLSSEDYYLRLLGVEEPWEAQQARAVLPNSLKTEIVVTANLREWRYIFKLRTSSKAHPQMKSLMMDMLDKFRTKIPIIFDNL